VELQYAGTDPDHGFADLDASRAEAEYAALVAEQEASAHTVAELDLDDTYLHEMFGPMSLRWGYLNLIQEYARHNGHADVLRERIDQVTGP